MMQGQALRLPPQNLPFFINSLLSPWYLALHGENNFFILNHSVGSIPHGVEIDVPLVYADYYLLEALYRKGKLSH